MKCGFEVEGEDRDNDAQDGPAERDHRGGQPQLVDVVPLQVRLLPPADFIGNLLVRIHFIIVMIRWTGLAPWEFESPFPGSLTSTFLEPADKSPWNAGLLALPQSIRARLFGEPRLSSSCTKVYLVIYDSG